MNTLFNTKKSNRWLFSFVIFSIFSSCAGIFLFLYYYQYAYVAYSLTFIPSVSILVYIYMITPYKIRQKLKSKNLPIPLNIFKWKSNELINLRINYIYKHQYKDGKKETINKLIEVSKELVEKPINNFFIRLEKRVNLFFKVSFILLPILISILIPFTVVIMGFLLDNELLLNKEEIKKTLPFIKEYSLYSSKLILLLFLYCLLFFLSYRMVRNDSLSRILDSKKEIEEYIFILKNAFILKSQKEKIKIKRTKNSFLTILRQLIN